MFAKPANAQPTAVAEGPRKPVPASLVAANVALSGELASDGEVHLDGTLQGDARVGRLLLGESGRIEGTIEADSVEIRGRVLGQISARAVRLYATADVEGDITYAELAIEAGARFNGRSLRSETAPALQVLTAAE
ncbi:MAG TPA: polymer-forming cytoskeletal protein [Phenylobacterium sp.]|jgi:cytoskeletal protein CcmA (bactofilin family)|nr:polymer-forming cytoskeletal protein [Phenylobacterium sp.]